MPIGQVKDGDTRFDRGLDSLSDLLSLPPGCYGWAVNMFNRGGVLQTRPGYNWKFTLPSGKLQGLSSFTPQIGKPVLVAFVDGIGYASNYPYTSFRRILGAYMSDSAEQVFTAQCVQTTQANPDGSITLILPKRVLMVQDGINPPAYFDGNKLTWLTGPGKTPQGTCMAWVGARLWVARGPLVFASDLGNPTSFTEQTYNTLGGVQYFTLPGNCTGLAPLPGAPNNNTQLLAFTDSTTNMFQANILNRNLWPNTANFQSVMFPTIGCVAPKSFAAVSGMLWWFSQLGTTRLDAAQASALTSRIFRFDRELTRSSYSMSHDVTKICTGVFENFVLLSTPYASKLNKHTWVYDSSVNDLMSQSAVSYLTSAWSSEWSAVWTGVQPVEWASICVDGIQRIFCASIDSDTGNRVYEGFDKRKRDNETCDIPWSLESRGFTANSPLTKQFRFLHYALSELKGQVNLRVSWAGVSRGRWKVISTPTFYSEEGNIVADRKYGYSDPLYGLKSQSRVARTQDVQDMLQDKLSSAGIEGLVEHISDNKETVDTAFNFRIDGSGPCAVRHLVAFMDPKAPPDSGQRDEIEKSGTHFVRFDGAASKTESDLDAPPDIYTASSSASAEWHNFEGVASATINGTISQAESGKRAQQVARARAEYFLRTVATPYVGGRLVEES